LVLPPEKCGLQSRLCQDVSCAIAFAIVVLVVLTQRLELRLPVERDRERFVQLFCDREFMVFSAGVLDREAANRRFDQMLIRAEEFPFAKQPVIDRSTGQILGYSGVDRFEFGGEAIPQRLGERCSPRRPRPTEGNSSR
jgi:RimJ/RimL family protein N-acetyltransferase